MTNDWRSIIQRRFNTFRQESGDYKMIFVRFDSPGAKNQMLPFADWLSQLRGAKTGTVPDDVIAEVRSLAD